MFSGIVREKARIQELRETRLVIESHYLREVTLGDSILVSGTCLSVVQIDGAFYHFDLASETLRRTSLGQKKRGDYVNIEPSLRLSDLIHGHVVQGHVDDVAELLEVKQEENTFRMLFALPKSVARFVAPKGSVTLDGVSLTVGEVTSASDTFAVYIIPHTWSETTLSSVPVGGLVNVEADCIARYVARLLEVR